MVNWWWFGLVAKLYLTLAIPWACQAPLSMGFFRQEYWSGLPFPSPRDLPKWRVGNVANHAGSSSGGVLAQACQSF